MTGHSMERVGDCKQCGKCCKTLEYIHVLCDENELSWLKAHSNRIMASPTGAQQHDIDGTVVAEGYLVSIPFPCEQLGADGRCLLHNTCKPELCRIYPTEQHWLDGLLEAGCGFSFVETAACATERGGVGSE